LQGAFRSSNARVSAHHHWDGSGCSIIVPAELKSKVRASAEIAGVASAHTAAAPITAERLVMGRRVLMCLMSAS